MTLFCHLIFINKNYDILKISNFLKPVPSLILHFSLRCGEYKYRILAYLKKTGYVFTCIKNYLTEDTNSRQPAIHSKMIQY